MDDRDATAGDILDQALQALRALLGPRWKVEVLPQQGGAEPDGVIDGQVRLFAPDGNGLFIDVFVIVKRDVTPRDVDGTLRHVSNIVRHTSSQRQRLLVLSPWISPRTQTALRAREIDYLDLTGNVSLSMDYPAIRIYTHGASRSPVASSASGSARTVTLAGSRAGRIVRFLADYAPPYRATDIAEATGVSLAWVSRLLGQLDDQLLIARHRRSIVEVNWSALLQERAQNYNLLRHNSYVGVLAVNGPVSVLSGLAKYAERNLPLPRTAVTGPYAAREVAPLGVGGQLMLYVEDVPALLDGVADELGLLEVDDGADVLLLHPHDPVVFDRTRTLMRVEHVALSQLVLDGLAGPGRMPAEATAVLNTMALDERKWRRPWSPGR